MATFQGRVLWYERGSSIHNKNDRCYFLAVAFQSGDEERDMLDCPTTYKKAILKGNDAKIALCKAQKLGLNIHEGLYDQPTYEPSAPHFFRMTSYEKPGVFRKGKEIKFESISSWELMEEVWQNTEDGHTNSQTQI